jgi:hypothetical protein
VSLSSESDDEFGGCSKGSGEAGLAPHLSLNPTARNNANRHLEDTAMPLTLSLMPDCRDALPEPPLNNGNTMLRGPFRDNPAPGAFWLC